MERRAFMQATAAGLAGTMLMGCLPGAQGRGVVMDPFEGTPYTPARRWLPSRFGRIAYYDEGRGPDALFLHGFPLNSYQWRGAIERLRAHRRCLAPDFLALGRTEVAPGQAVDPEAQVAMVLHFLDRMGAPSADLIASDSGGAIAQLLAVRYPERVRSLLLTNCDEEQNSPPPAVVPVIEAARRGRFAEEWMLPLVADHEFARSERGFSGACYLDPRNPTDAAIAEYMAPLVATPERKALVDRYALGLEPNPLAGITPMLAKVTIPVRIVWGMGDTIFDPASADRLDRAFGHSQGVRRLERYKIFWPEERPDIVAEEARLLWGV